MDIQLEVGLYIFILAGFLGYHVITRVPPLLHTPLMSATNAMSGISLVGSIVVAGSGKGCLGTFLAEYGMALAVLGTLFDPAIQGSGYVWIVLGLLIGTGVGGTIAWSIPMTAVPQRTAFSHSLGALAATLIGIAEYVHHQHD